LTQQGKTAPDVRQRESRLLEGQRAPSVMVLADRRHDLRSKSTTTTTGSATIQHRQNRELVRTTI